MKGFIASDDCLKFAHKCYLDASAANLFLHHSFRGLHICMTLDHHLTFNMASFHFQCQLESISGEKCFSELEDMSVSRDLMCTKSRPTPPMTCVDSNSKPNIFLS